MFRTFRRRYILSQVLPLLIVIPLIGLSLIAILESQLLLPSLARELGGQAALIAEIAEDQPGLWSDPAQAHAFVTRIDPLEDAQLTLVDTAGRLVASSNPADAGRQGQTLNLSQLPDVLAGAIRTHTTYSSQFNTDVIEVLAPVADAGQHVVGVIRLSYRLADIYAQFVELRYFVGGVLLVGMPLGTLMGWILAANMVRPLDEMSRAVSLLTKGGHPVALSETGPEELNRLAHAFNGLTLRLSLREEARRHLLVNLAHELGNPLGALHSAVEALQRGADADAAFRQELLAGMDGSLDRLHNLLDDLARLQDQILGALELARRSVALSEWLPPVLLLWREAAQAKGLHWQSAIRAILPVIEADPDRLGQAVGNMLSNAIKYTPSGGAISVEAGAGNEAVWIRVGDSGPGIAQDEQARVFEPLYRGQRDRPTPEGMGLGLTIARDLVNAHGGRLELDSAPGFGSRFTIWLPLRT